MNSKIKFYYEEKGIFFLIFDYDENIERLIS